MRLWLWPILLIMSLLMARAEAEPARLVVLGDSLVQGYGLLPDEGFVPQLQTWLDENGYDVQVMNAGVSGDTTRGGRSRIGWVLADDVDALIVSLGGNDALRGIDPTLSRENLDAILSAAAGKGVPVLLVGIAAPGNFGPDYSREFEAIFPELAEKFDIILYPNFLQILMQLPDRSGTLEKFYQADALHPNARGIAMIVEDMGPYVARLLQEIR